MKQHRIDRLLESHALEPVAADDAEIAAIWTAALREWADASVPGLSVAGAFLHVYQAAFRAGTAVIRAAGYRVRSAVGGHHHTTFYAVAALAEEEMERLADGLQALRGGRHAALYSDEEEVLLEDLERARESVGRFLVAVHTHLGTDRADLALRLKAPEGSA